ncbi:sulfurtransferase complex subunit TusB [Rhodoferax sp.]|jgi:tRNA 2-thiouridine synthesizing protein B|uniref:sulfurtransferase complex subunit TusB n=1 Tax=Rhodoferax sp. TaxID=50421 RepID=UPI00284D329E|nr:sulfurtransferase complex subunit TusB [Rhodoferax sp.]MDR3370508.1 sulfurtransferase complex subunit TusB [Rhodoferax sp.]
MLHIVNKSPFQTSTLKSCLAMAQPGSAVLLIEDGVYGATQGSTIEADVRQASASIKFYALQPDMDARGVTPKLMNGITLVDYGGFVDLTVQYSTSHSWL